MVVVPTMLNNRNLEKMGNATQRKQERSRWNIVVWIRWDLDMKPVASPTWPLSTLGVRALHFCEPMSRPQMLSLPYRLRVFTKVSIKYVRTTSASGFKSHCTRYTWLALLLCFAYLPLCWFAWWTPSSLFLLVFPVMLVVLVFVFEACRALHEEWGVVTDRENHTWV